METNCANSNYRVLIPLRALERRGHDVLFPSHAKCDIPIRELITCDLVHCFRRLDRAEDLKMLSGRGVAVSFDNDDDLSALELSTSGRDQLSGVQGLVRNRKSFAAMKRVAQRADLMTTPSPKLADMFRDAGVQHVCVIENYLERGSPDFSGSAKHAGLVVGWIAGKEHEMDLPQIPIVDAMCRLLERHPELRIVTAGTRLPLRSERYEYHQEVPFGELPQFIGRMDIGIAPLADVPFNRSRSNIKLKEYAAGGTPWLASPVGGYVGLGPRQGGHLVGDDGWFEALDDLITHHFKRRRLARRASRWAASQVIDGFAEQWEGAFQSAIERASRRFESRVSPVG